MLHATLLSFLIGLEVVASDIVRSDVFTVHADRAWVGQGVANVTALSITECIVSCGNNDGCNAANYETERGTCQMLNVADVDADWRDVDTGTQMLTNMDANLEACVAFWPFDGNVASLWRTTTIVAPSSEAGFENLPNSDTQAVRFRGEDDSYIVLENHGDLNVTEFAWAAKVFPQGHSGGYWRCSCGRSRATTCATT